LIKQVKNYINKIDYYRTNQQAANRP